jgi:hypothetical protein
MGSDKRPQLVLGLLAAVAVIGILLAGVSCEPQPCPGPDRCPYGQDAYQPQVAANLLDLPPDLRTHNYAGGSCCHCAIQDVLRWHGFAVTSQHALVIALVATIAALVVGIAVGWAFRKDTELEKRQKALCKLATLLEKYGFEHLSSIVTNLAVKDLSGVITETLILLRQMENEDIAMQILAKNFYHQLGVRVQRAEDWPKIQRVIQDRAAAERAEADRRMAAYQYQAARATETAASAQQPGATPGTLAT